MNTNDTSKARFCAQCGSPSVEYSALEGGEASCTSCQWRGSKTDLLVSPFQHRQGSEEQLVIALERDVRNALAKGLSFATAKVLIHWGFIDADAPSVEQAHLLGRYMRGIGRSVVMSILETRKDLEAERAKKVVS